MHYILKPDTFTTKVEIKVCSIDCISIQHKMNKFSRKEKYVETLKFLYFITSSSKKKPLAKSADRKRTMTHNLHNLSFDSYTNTQLKFKIYDSAHSKEPRGSLKNNNIVLEIKENRKKAKPVAKPR